MENKITLKNTATYVTLFVVVIAVAVLVAQLIVHFSSKRMRDRAAIPVIEPKQVLSNVYKDANNYFLGDTMPIVKKLDSYCSKRLVAVFKQNPGIMVYSFARETRNGHLKNIDIISQQYNGADSAIIYARAMYNDGTAKDFKQYLIKEDGLWKLGLKYGHDIK